MSNRHVGDYGGVSAGDSSWLAHRAASVPERLALRCRGVDLTYAELGALVGEEAQRLGDEGVGEGAVVEVDSRASVETVTSLHALWSLGACAAPQVSVAQRHSGMSRTLASEDAMCRLLTSGTTGEPKVVDLTRENFFASAVGTSLALGLGPADRWLCCVPLHHVAGLSIITRAAIGGFGIVLHDGFDIPSVAESLFEDGVTLVSLVATQLIRLLEADVDLTGPRALVMGGGPVPLDAIEEATARGATVIQVYGMTETTSQVTLLEPADAARKAGSAGRPLLGAELRIDSGEILVRGPVVSPSASVEGGWLRTGDLGAIDDEGFLWVDGRLGDLIVTGGENVMPQRVEDELMAHPDVEDAAVVGRPDPEWQEAVTAVIVLRPGAREDSEALRAHCVERLARYEVPKSFVFVPELPRTASGKLMRSVLR